MPIIANRCSTTSREETRSEYIKWARKLVPLYPRLRVYYSFLEFSKIKSQISFAKYNQRTKTHDR